jgi:hypothetical protein
MKGRAMAGRKLDRSTAKTALATVRESPVITAIVGLPAAVLFILAWVLGGFGWAILTLVALAGVGYLAFRYT